MGDNIGGGSVVRQPIRFQCGGVAIYSYTALNLVYMYVWTVVGHMHTEFDLCGTY
jgi:hypothetical protein